MAHRNESIATGDDISEKKSFSSGDHVPKIESPRESVQEGDTLLADMGYTQELQRNRNMFTLLFQSLAMAAVPYGVGGPLIYAIYGGGQLSLFVGWIVAGILAECVSLSLSELTSRYPISAGPPYYAFRLASKHNEIFAYITGWVWITGNWTILLSVNFGFASLVAGGVSMFVPDFEMTAWQLLLIFYAVTLFTFVVCTFFNKYLPHLDTICAAFTGLAILIICISLSVKADAGRHSAAVGLGQYDKTISGWNGFSWFIGLLPAIYVFIAPGLMTAMAEEVPNPTVNLPTAITWTIPIAGVAGFFFILPICFTMPALADIAEAPYAQALPYIFYKVMGTPGGGLGLLMLVLIVTMFCSISVTVAISRTTWAFARDKAIPGYQLWGRMNKKLGVPVWSIVLITVLQLLLGLIYLGSTAAFTAFISVGVQGLSLSFAIPIILSLMNARKEVAKAKWKLNGFIGIIVNVVALVWIAFEIILLSMPGTLPVTLDTMNYASVLLVGFIAIAAMWYAVYARKHYKGPPVVSMD